MKSAASSFHRRRPYLRQSFVQRRNTGAADLPLIHQNAQTIYAVLWAARVAPWEIRSGESFIGAGSGLFKSTDGGKHLAPAHQASHSRRRPQPHRITVAQKASRIGSTPGSRIRRASSGTVRRRRHYFFASTVA